MEDSADSKNATADGFSKLIETFSAFGPIPNAPAVLQARRNAVARRAFLSEQGALTPREAAARAGLSSSNASRQIRRWIGARLAFVVEVGGSKLLPAFQFDPHSGRLRPETARLLAVFAGRRKGWEIALWMTAPNGWLQGARPIEVWPESLEQVLEAARHEVEPVGT